MMTSRHGIIFRIAGPLLGYLEAVLLNKLSKCRCRISGLILGLRLTNERRRYKVTPSLIGWAQTWNQF